MQTMRRGTPPVAAARARFGVSASNRGSEIATPAARRNVRRSTFMSNSPSTAMINVPDVDFPPACGRASKRVECATRTGIQGLVHVRRDDTIRSIRENRTRRMAEQSWNRLEFFRRSQPNDHFHTTTFQTGSFNLMADIMNQRRPSSDTSTHPPCGPAGRLRILGWRRIRRRSWRGRGSRG